MSVPGIRRLVVVRALFGGAVVAGILLTSSAPGMAAAQPHANSTYNVDLCDQPTPSNDQAFNCSALQPSPGPYIGTLATVTDGTNDWIFAWGNDSHLYQWKYTLSQQTVPTASDITLGGGLITSSPSAVFDGTYVHVFAIGANGDMLEYENNGGGGNWTLSDLNAVDPGSPQVTPYFNAQIIGGVIHVYTANAANGDLVEIDNDNQSGHAWNFYDETAFSGNGVSITGAPSALQINGYVHVYVRSSGANHLIEYVDDHLGGHVWNAYDQTAGANAPPMFGNPIPLLVGGVPHIYTDDAVNGDLIEYVADHLNGHIWNAYDQTVASGAPHLQGNPSAVQATATTVEVFENTSGTLTEVASDHQGGSVWNAYAIVDQSANQLPIVGDPTAWIGENQVIQFTWLAP